MAHESVAQNKFVAVCCYSPILKFTATHCITLQQTGIHCNALQHTETHCNTLQRLALQRLAVCCSALLPTHTCRHLETHTLSDTKTNYNTLHHNATHYNTLQHTATHCNTLQYTAIHCNTLQHTHTHSKHAPNHHVGPGHIQIQPWRCSVHSPIATVMRVAVYVLQCVAVCCSVL